MTCLPFKPLRRLGICLLLLIAADSLSAQPATQPAGQAFDGLWFREPAAEWTQALPIGNGRLGAMVFGGIAKERLQLNEPHPAQISHNGERVDAADEAGELHFTVKAGQTYEIAPLP